MPPEGKVTPKESIQKTIPAASSSSQHADQSDSMEKTGPPTLPDASSSQNADQSDSIEKPGPPTKKPEPPTKKREPPTRTPGPPIKRAKTIPDASSSSQYADQIDSNEKPEPPHEKTDNIEEIVEGDLLDTQAEKKAQGTKKVRKGAARSSITTIIESPGDPNRPSTFLNIKSNEQKLGAYLGYNDVAHLRVLTLSWPVLKGYLSFDPIPLNMNRKAAFRLLHDNEEYFRNVDRKVEWPILQTDEKELAKNKKVRHLACILLQMETDIKSLGSLSLHENTIQQSKYYDLFCEANDADVERPLLIDFENNILGTPVIRLPNLGLYRGESRMESVNRCWNLLQYIRYCRQAQGMWQARFSKSAVPTSSAIHISHVPSWLRPPVLIERPDSLSHLEIPIVWDKDFDFVGQDEMIDALKDAERRGVAVPSTHQNVRQDPRLCTSIEAFKDSIRRQYNCQELLINIRTLTLSYQNKGTQKLNILKANWTKTKSSLIDTTNSDVALRVVFEALDDPDESVYESFEPPPALSAFFDTSSGDVIAKSEGLLEIADAAFNFKP